MEKIDIEKKAGQLYDRMFDRWYSGYDKVFDSTSDWNCEECKHNGRERIKELLLQGKKVKTGYTCCKIRGFHQHRIFWK
jgi:hypothetical protein